MKIRKFLSGGAAVAVAVAASVLSVPLAHADQTTPGTFNTVTSKRILDTRDGVGARKAPVAARSTLTFTATDADTGLNPAAVVLNVTAVEPKTAGYLTVYATGKPQPLASNLNFQPGQNVPNLVITPVGPNGAVSIFNGSDGTVDVLADIHGYYLGGTNTGEAGTFVPTGSRRFLDTRGGIPGRAPQVRPKAVIKLPIAGRNGIPADASAVVANITAVQGAGKGFITAFQGDMLPIGDNLTSNVNYKKKEDRANLALIALAGDGSLSLYNGSPTAVDLVVDITGYYVGGTPSADGSFVPSSPFRIFDSRPPNGDLAEGNPAGALTTSKIRIFPSGDPTATFFKAVVVNVTAVGPQASGFLTTWDGVGPLPSVSSSNFRPGDDVAGSVLTPVNPDGTISIYNGSFGTVHLVVDVTGFVFALPDSGAPASASPVSAEKRIADVLAKMKEFSKHPASVPVSVTTNK